MNWSIRRSHDSAADPSQEDGGRPVSAEADPVTSDVAVPGAELTSETALSVGDADPAASAGDPVVDTVSPEEPARRLTRVGAAWAAIVGALVLLVVLIVFVLQNPEKVVIHFLGWSASLAVGMAMLIAAVTGGGLVATVGVARMTQLRVRAHRTRNVPR